MPARRLDEAGQEALGVALADPVVITCLGVVAAHDRAIRIFPRRHQVSGQLPLLFVMVVYTVGGLYLLFNG